MVSCSCLPGKINTTNKALNIISECVYAARDGPLLVSVGDPADLGKPFKSCGSGTAFSLASGSRRGHGHLQDFE